MVRKQKTAKKKVVKRVNKTSILSHKVDNMDLEISHLNNHIHLKIDRVTVLKQILKLKREINSLQISVITLIGIVGASLIISIF